MRTRFAAIPYADFSTTGFKWQVGDFRTSPCVVVPGTKYKSHTHAAGLAERMNVRYLAKRRS